MLAVRIPAHAAQEESTTVGVIVENLKSGAQYLWSTKLLRWLFLINLPVMLSFGLWNVLLLPMAIRELNATEFEYGLQEGVTSVGFVVGSLLMARYGDRLPEGTWMVAGTTAHGRVRGPVRPRAEHRDRDRAGDGHRLPQLADVDRAPRPAAEEHPAGDARTRVLGVLPCRATSSS